MCLCVTVNLGTKHLLVVLEVYFPQNGTNSCIISEIVRIHLPKIFAVDERVTDCRKLGVHILLLVLNISFRTRTEQSVERLRCVSTGISLRGPRYLQLPISLQDRSPATVAVHLPQRYHEQSYGAKQQLYDSY